MTASQHSEPTHNTMLPFGGGGGRVGRTRMRLDEMDCADIMRKAVQRKRSRSIARRESFSGTEDDLKKFREAVEANDKDSDLQKDIEEYAVKVREIRAGKEEDSAEKPSSSADKVEKKNTPQAQSSTAELAKQQTPATESEKSNNQTAEVLETKENDGKKIEATEDVEVVKEEVKEEGPLEENKDSPVQAEVEKQNLDSNEVEDKPTAVTDDAGEESEQATEITRQKEEQTSSSVDVNLEIEKVAKECEQIGDADEIKDPNEAENQTDHTEDSAEKSEQIPTELTESENVVAYPGVQG